MKKLSYRFPILKRRELYFTQTIVTSRKWFGHGLLFLLLAFDFRPAHSATFSAETFSGQISRRAWTTLRDADLIRQKYDYSCGAASLATILSNYYDTPVTEQDILNKMGKQQIEIASFADLAEVMSKYGFRGIGLAMSHKDLQKLKVPAILYVKFRKQDHFVVLRGISEHLAWLGDPSAGNLVLTSSQLREVWETRNDPRYQGKVLLVLPAADTPIRTNKNFFRTPTTSALSAKLLSIRSE